MVDTPPNYFLRFLAYLVQFKHYWMAILIFFLGLLISASLFDIYRNAALNRLRSEYSQLADSRIVLVQEVLNDTIKQFEYTKQFFNVMGPSNITKQIFHEIVNKSLILYPNIIAMAWMDLFDEPNSDLGFYFLQPENSEEKKFVSLDFLELGSIQPPFYFNLDDYTKFQDAYEDVKKNKLLTISEKTRYFEEGEKSGFFIFDPVLSDSSDRTNAGWLIGFSDLNAIIENINQKTGSLGVNISLYEVKDGQEKLLLGSKDNSSIKTTAKEQNIINQWTINRPIKVGNQQWLIKAIPDTDFLKHHLWTHWEVLAIGLALSLLLASYFLSLVNRRLLIEKEVELRTNELEKANNQLQEEVHSRQMIEMEMSKKQRYLQKQHETLEYLTKLSVSEFETALKEVILRTSSIMEVDRTSVWLYETIDDRLVLTCKGLYNYLTNTFDEPLEFLSDEFPHYFHALTLHCDLIIPSTHNLELNAELSSYLTTFHILSKLDLPIIFEGKLLGILSIEETRQPRQWELEDRHFGHNVADIIAIMIEQAARRKAENALSVSQERLRFITQKGADAIISVSDKDEIMSWNEGAEHMFGYTESEMLKGSLSTIIPDHELHQEKVALKPIELMGKHKNGKFIPAEVSHSRWKMGEKSYDTVIIRDITERKENEKKLIKAIREANAANEAKSEFLTIVSHELRTPLNAIIGYDQCLIMEMDGPVNPEQMVSLKKIEKSSFHLLNLINDILDLAKIEANKMELEITPQNIVETIVSCVDEIQSLARQKELKIILSFSKPYVLMEYDKTRIRQVILNLLGNAVKFTEKGSITISLMNYQNYVEIHITDTGIGLSPEEIIKLFMAFSQADSSITRKYGGSGLGLTISKKIVDMHGGKIDVKSEKEHGSTFIVTLPKIQ
jgi:PAS domain S-box-containing protein